MKKHLIAMIIGVTATVGTVSVMASSFGINKHKFKDDVVTTIKQEANLVSSEVSIDSVIFNQYINLNEYIINDVSYVSIDEISKKYLNEYYKWTTNNYNNEDSKPIKLSLIYKGIPVLKEINFVETSEGKLISFEFFEDDIYPLIN